MNDQNTRHPFKNFFIKRSIQFKITGQILLTFLISALLTLTFFICLYNSVSKKGSFYYMSNDIMQDLQLKSMLGIILPPIITVELIAIIISFGIGLYSSRKIAVPIYKIEKWAARLKNGKLNTTLAFREENSFKELTIQCNGVTEFYRKIFSKIRDHNNNITQKPNDPSVIMTHTHAIEQLLTKIELPCSDPDFCKSLE